MNKKKGKFKLQNYNAVDSVHSVTVTLLFKQNVIFWWHRFLMYLLAWVHLTVQPILHSLRGWTCLILQGIWVAWCHEVTNIMSSSFIILFGGDLDLFFAVQYIAQRWLITPCFDFVWKWQWCSLSPYLGHYKHITDHLSAYTGAYILYQVLLVKLWSDMPVHSHLVKVGNMLVSSAQL